MKSSFVLVVAVLVVLLAVPDYTSAASATEQLRPQRRRRPSPADVDIEGVMTSSARRSNARPTNNGKTFHWDVAESCKVEPGCEWSCSGHDVSDCRCRCKFDEPQVASIRYLSSRLSWN